MKKKDNNLARREFLRKTSSVALGLAVVPDLFARRIAYQPAGYFPYASGFKTSQVEMPWDPSAGTTEDIKAKLFLYQNQVTTQTERVGRRHITPSRKHY